MNISTINTCRDVAALGAKHVNDNGARKVTIMNHTRSISEYVSLK